MSEQSSIHQVSHPSPGDGDSAKRRQIVEGAQRVFMSHGFDAASMGEIAKAAGVSKGTLYVYFQNKEQLFEAIVQQECVLQVEGVLDFDPGDHDVERTLARFGEVLAQGLCTPERVSAVRAVIAIAERMPQAGRIFYEMGPARGIKKLAAYLEAQNAAGVLKVDDCDLAAAMFMDTCLSTLIKPLLFNAAGAPTPERVTYVVGVAVRNFLKLYRAP